jgi:Mrp family chromosome partitioning ATPase
MFVLTSGSLPPNPSELLASQKMERILEDLKKVTDTIILDGPPFIVSDPIVLSSKVDGVLLVIKPGGTKIEAAQAMIEQLQRAGAWVVGVVLNPISRKQAGYYGKYRHYNEYYTSGYGYGHSTGSGGAPAPTQGD